MAPHSVRAVPREWLTVLAGIRGDLPVHMHVAEQPKELEACQAEHGRRPVELLEELGVLESRFTAVHAVHVTQDEARMLGEVGAGVCACPSTERNLGDGIVPADMLASAGARLCLGSDSQATVDLLDEARQLEGHLRLARLRRAVLDPGGGAVDGLAARLFEMATVNGARSLGLPTGTLEPGAPGGLLHGGPEPPLAGGRQPRFAALGHRPGLGQGGGARGGGGRAARGARGSAPARGGVRPRLPCPCSEAVPVTDTLPALRATLAELVALDTTSVRPNAPLIDYAQQRLEAAGFSAERQRYTDDAGVEKVNLVAVKGGSGRAALALVGHSDCVPYDAAWTDALKLTEREGRLYGRGACDTKGFIACALEAALKAQSLKAPLMVVLTADEEVGLVGAKRLVEAGLGRARHAIVGEPTTLEAGAREQRLLSGGGGGAGQGGPQCVPGHGSLGHLPCGALPAPAGGGSAHGAPRGAGRRLRAALHHGERGPHSGRQGEEHPPRACAASRWSGGPFPGSHRSGWWS